MGRWLAVVFVAGGLVAACGRVGYDVADGGGLEPSACHGSDACELSCPSGEECLFRCAGSSRCTVRCETACVVECGGAAECTLLCGTSEQRCSGPGCTLSCRRGAGDG